MNPDEKDKRSKAYLIGRGKLSLQSLYKLLRSVMKGAEPEPEAPRKELGHWRSFA